MSCGPCARPWSEPDPAMFESLSRILLPWLRIPPEPQAPAGAAGSLRVFRAAPNYYRLRVLGWSLKQGMALVGLVVALVLLHGGVADSLVRRNPRFEPMEALILGLEWLGFVGFVIQLPFTYAATRLDYQLRWYLVTDRSLRIRAGIWTVEELTMTFANIQEITVHQGPLQRILGIADLKVRSAGGGAAVQEGHARRETHVAWFHGVENAEAIRDLILDPMRRQRDTGLGDPDGPPPEAGLVPADDLRSAARALLDEARALRASMARSEPGR